MDDCHERYETLVKSINKQFAKLSINKLDSESSPLDVSDVYNAVAIVKMALENLNYIVDKVNDGDLDDTQKWCEHALDTLRI